MCGENKDAAVTAQLICAIVFANANCWFSDAKAHNKCQTNEEISKCCYVPVDAKLISAFDLLNKESASVTSIARHFCKKKKKTIKEQQQQKKIQVSEKLQTDQ